MPTIELFQAKILFAEDDFLNQGILLKLFRKEGFCNVHAVSDGCELMDRLAESDSHSQPYDLLLTDHDMPPGPNGSEILQRIRTGGFRINYQRLPVIVQTGRRDLVTKLMENGATEVLLKPIIFSDLLRTIDRVLKK